MGLFTTHSATVDAEVDVPYRCRACGATGRALVAGDGVGARTTISFAGDGHGPRAALEEARADAAHQARVIVKLARCPRCRRVSTLARAAFLVPALIRTTLLLGIAAAGFWLGGMIGIGFGLLVTAAAVAFAMQQFHKLAHTERFVRVLELAPVALPRATALRLPEPSSASAESGDNSPRILR